MKWGTKRNQGFENEMPMIGTRVWMKLETERLNGKYDLEWLSE